MTAHLTLNLIWLWLFLRDDKIGHGAAICVGFLASGLHQLIFHPLFVAPFIVRLWASGRRPLALTYVVSYAAICLFWISYWQIVLEWQGMSPQDSGDAGPLYFMARGVPFGKLPLDGRWADADECVTICRLAKSDAPAFVVPRLSFDPRR